MANRTPHFYYLIEGNIKYFSGIYVGNRYLNGKYGTPFLKHIHRSGCTKGSY